VLLDNVRCPRPGVTVYEGLTLANPETGARVLRCRRLEIGPAAGSDGVLAIAASQVTLEPAELEELRRLADQTLTRRAGGAANGISLAAEKLIFSPGDRFPALIDARAKLLRLTGETQVEISFWLEGMNPSDPIRVRVRRSHDTQPPATAFDLDTGRNGLPCSLLGVVFRPFLAAGPSARFQGYFWAGESPEGFSGEVRGDFLDADLESLAAGRLGHLLSGRARITIQSARFQQGRLQAAVGKIVTSAPGMAGYSLLEAAVTQLGFTAGSAPSTTAEGVVPYDQLALSFLLDGNGLQVRGDCPPAGSGSVLVAPAGVLLAQPRAQPLAIASLVRALAPIEEAQVPLNPQTEWLIARLPSANSSAAIGTGATRGAGSRATSIPVPASR